MNNFLKAKHILVIFCATLSIAYSQTDDDMLSALPFDFMEFIEWGVARDKTEEHDERRFKEFYLSENEDLMQLIGRINEHAYRYLILKNDKTDCIMYITTSSQEDVFGLYYDLTNTIENRIVGYLPLGALLEGKRKTFVISSDLEITLYDEKTVYSKKEGRDVVIKKEMTGKCRIQKDGSIVKIK